MRPQPLYLMLCIFLMLSCKSNEAYHLPPEKMQKILFDVHLAESYSMVVHQDSAHRNTERNMDTLALMYKTVFDHYEITQKDFISSLEWYKHNPEELDSIYSAMLPEFSKLEATYEKP